MVNSLKIKGRMAEKNITIQKLCVKIPCSAYTLGKKISNKTPINLEEIAVLCKELDIQDCEFSKFFLQ